MLDYREIDFDEVWFETMGWNSFCQEGRKFLMMKSMIFGKN